MMTALWTWLITPPTTDSVLDLFGIVYLIVFAGGFVVCAYASGPGAAHVARNTVQLQGILQWANIGLAVFGTGLFFFGVRALQIDPLSFGAPIWMVAMVLVLAVAAVRCRSWWTTVYPSLLADGAADANVRAPGEPG
jgi:hypothetical protein